MQFLGQWDEACQVLSDRVVDPLAHDLGLYADLLALVRPFFPNGWSQPRDEIGSWYRGTVATIAGMALGGLDLHEAAEVVEYLSLTEELDGEADPSEVHMRLHNLGETLEDLDRIADVVRLRRLTVRLTEVMGLDDRLFQGRLDWFRTAALIGDRVAATGLWQALDPMGRGWERWLYRPGQAEGIYLTAYAPRARSGD